MDRTLVIGFGNPSRQDDGVGLAAVNALRARLGVPLLDEYADGWDELGGELDTLFLQQLSPELAETLADYARVIFVDARLAPTDELVCREEVSPTAGPSLVSHHMKPGALLALTERLYGRAPHGELISIRGTNFDFGSSLSPDAQRGVEEVAASIYERYRPGPTL